jgi:hypothetical protein
MANGPYRYLAKRLSLIKCGQDLHRGTESRGHGSAKAEPWDGACTQPVDLATRREEPPEGVLDEPLVSVLPYDVKSGSESWIHQID